VHLHYRKIGWRDLLIRGRLHILAVKKHILACVNNACILYSVGLEPRFRRPEAPMVPKGTSPLFVV